MTTKETAKTAEIDRLIHQPTRLRIMHALIEEEVIEFTTLKESVGTSAGNLTTHLSRLETAGYLRSEKTITDGQIKTVYWLTVTGVDRFKRYQLTIRELTAQPTTDVSMQKHSVTGPGRSQCLEAHHQ